LNTLISFVKTFEERFRDELADLMEYKLEIVEQTTYYVQRQAVREFTARLNFVSASRNNAKFVELRKMLGELSGMHSARVEVNWKVFESLPVLFSSDLQRIGVESEQGYCYLCSNCSKIIGDSELIGVCRQCTPNKLFCKRCTFANEDKYFEFHNHFQRTNLVDHTHSLILVDSLQTLKCCNPNILFSKVVNQLNAIYQEGLRATREGDFKEFLEVDIGFNTACDSCLVEIEQVMMICLGCRCRNLCSDCFTQQANSKQVPDGKDNTEHSY
jgi:hypothetical protein